MVFFVTLLSSQLATRLQTEWKGLSKWWALAPIGLLLVYRLLRANYDHFEQVTKSFDGAESKWKIAEQRLHDISAGPEFVGHLYQIQVFPRSGLLDPSMYHQAINLAHGRDALDKADPPKFSYDVFVEAYIQNNVPGKGSIIDYILELELGGTYIKLQREFNFKGWMLDREESQMNAKNWLTTSTKHVKDAIPDLSVMASGVMEQGKGVEGWLHYVLRDVPYTELDGQAKYRLTLYDGKGKAHEINAAWINGPRPWRITFDI